MRDGILLVNCYHSRFYHFPVGSLGICDYVTKNGYRAAIFNSSQYSEESYLGELSRVIRYRKPTVIGLILHWKEVLPSFLFLLKWLEVEYPHIPIIVGGITAGFFSETLLKRNPHIRAVIRGDAEYPLLCYLKGDSLSKIPNCIYRDNTGIVTSKHRFVLSQEDFDGLCYSNFYFLCDHERYLRQFGGITLSIARGCPYNCLSCGGSRSANRKHSDRAGYLLRSRESVIRDLRKLKKYTSFFYVCNEVSQKYFKHLLMDIISDDGLRKVFSCGYGAYYLVDDELLELYGRAFKYSEACDQAVIELSPESAIDRDRMIVRDKALFFSNEQLHDAIEKIQDKYDGGVKVEVFFSYFHKTHSREKLYQECSLVHRLRSWSYSKGWSGVLVRHEHLSTDPGSDYWYHQFAESDEKDGGYDELIEGLRHDSEERIREQVCLYHPRRISKKFVSHYGRLCIHLQTLIDEVPYYYFITTAAYGFKGFYDAVLQVVESEDELFLKDGLRGVGFLSLQPGEGRRQMLAHFIASVEKCLRRADKKIFSKNELFFNGLTSLVYKDLSFVRTLSMANGVLPEDASCYVDRPKLRKDVYLIAPFNYYDHFLPKNIARDGFPCGGVKTAYVFVPSEVYSFEYRAFLILRGALDGKRPLKEGMNFIRDELKDDAEEILCFLRDYLHAIT